MDFTIPNSPYHLRGESRAGEGASCGASGTCFRVPQLGWFFDCGRSATPARAGSVFITHTHLDHTVDAPMLLSRGNTVHFFVPTDSVELFDLFLRAAVAMNGSRTRKALYAVRGVSPGDEFRVSKVHSVRILPTCHVVPSVGYGFWANRRQLRPEFVDRSDIRDLVRQGIRVHDEISEPMFAYLGDTTAAAFEGAAGDNLAQYPVIVSECTFLGDADGKAETYGHMCWPQLRPWAVAHPATHLILTHFSMRYSARAIYNFFVAQGLPNVTPWISDF